MNCSSTVTVALVFAHLDACGYCWPWLLVQHMSPILFLHPSMRRKKNGELMAMTFSKRVEITQERMLTMHRQSTLILAPKTLQ
jgi:hypothetical protein